MSEDERKHVRDAFIARLNTARRIAGSPSYKEIEIWSKKLQGHVVAAGLKVTMLPASTVHRTLQGPGRDLPKWRSVAILVFVLRGIAEDNGVAPGRVGTLADWKARHETAHAEMYDAASSTRELEQSLLRPVGITDVDVNGVGPDQSIREAMDLLCRHASPGQEPHRLRTLARETMRLDWWWDYQDVVPRWFRIYLSLEPAASLIRTYESHLIPGLLQTPAYAEAVIRQHHPHLLTSQIQRRQALRGWRQQILYRPKPVRLWTVIDETTLRHPIDRETMRAQVSHLIDMCRLPNVAVQVMPVGTVSCAVAGGPVTLLRFPQREFRDVIYLEQLASSLYPHTLYDLEHYDSLLTRVAIEAYSPEESVRVLHRIRRQM